MFLKKFFKNHLIEGGIAFFIGGIISNIFNYLYRIIIGRMLSPELFGELVAMISLILILIVPSAPLQTAATRFSAVFQTKYGPERIKRLFQYLTKIMVLMGLGLIILTVILSGQISNFLKLSSKNHIYFLAAIVAVMLVAGVAKGILQGLKRFSQLSFSVILEAVAKVGLAVILVALGFKISGALAGFFLSLILGYLLTVYFLKDVLITKISNARFQISKIKNKELNGVWIYIFNSLLVFLFLNLLLNLDKILVKHYFTGFQAGIYSAFTTLSQGVFIVVTSLAGVMFPLVAFQQAKKENYFPSLKVISLISFLLGAIAILILFLFPKELILIFFGQKYLEGVSFLGCYSIAMGFCGFIFILSSFFMALNKFKFLYFLAVGTILEILLISFWHSNFLQVILMLSLSLITTLFGMLFLIFLEKQKMTAQNRDKEVS